MDMRVYKASDGAAVANLLWWFIDEVSWLPDTKIVAQWNGIHNVKVSRL